MHIFGMVTTKHSDHYTDYALRTFFNTTPFAENDRFFLINNDSTYQLKQDEFAQVSIINNPAPLGFSANANQIARIALEQKADLVFLNNDLIFTSNWFDPLIGHPLTIISPLSNRELQYRTDIFSTTVAMELSDYLGHEEALEQIAQIHRARNHEFLNVLALPFFCVKIPHTVLAKVGFLDETFGKGGAEDYDYCLRAHLRGCNVQFALQSYILHFGGKSSWSGAESSVEQNQREATFKQAFVEKWGSPLYELLVHEKREDITPALAREIERGNYSLVIESLKQN